jgi:methylated-DNA-protein-cysteine methyltransferase related protein
VTLYETIYAIIRQIPSGRVATYGQVAGLAGIEGRARQVGYALRHLPDRSGVPWHRVVNAQGQVSSRGSDSMALQRKLLEAEGVVFDDGGRLPLDRFRWQRRARPSVDKPRYEE